jgi:hypothetical protein
MSGFRVERHADLQADTNVSEGNTASIFRAEDGESMLIRNPGINLQVNMASRPRRQPWILPYVISGLEDTKWQ